MSDTTSVATEISDNDAHQSTVQALKAEIEELKNKLAESNERTSKQKEYSSTVYNQECSSCKKLKDAETNFELEKSARTDLEMYVAVLNTQKTLLQEDMDRLKEELCNVCRMFELEKANHNELKQTWKLANEQFLMQQEFLLSELEQTRGTLNPQQSSGIEHSDQEKVKVIDSALPEASEIEEKLSTKIETIDEPRMLTSESDFDEQENPENINLDKKGSIWTILSDVGSHPCMMCQNYEKQLQLLQKDYLSINDREQSQRDVIKSINEQLSYEKEHVKSLEHSIEKISADYRLQIDIYEKNQLVVEEQVEKLQSEFRVLQTSMIEGILSSAK